MPRAIPIALKEHLSQDATTTTLLMKITPVTPGFSAYGATLLDQDVRYDDGVDDLVYHACIGMQPPDLLGTGTLETGADTVDSLLPEFDIPELTEESIRAGAYDYANYAIYLVNYRDTSQGHVTLQAGTIGQVSIRSDGLSFVNELRGLTAELKQSICEKDSLTCRAVFGSQPVGSLISGPQVAWGWCGFDATSLLVESTVASVGVETTLTFQVADATDWVAGMLAPGVAKFLTGRNAGRTFEISDNDDSGWITLAHETPFPISEEDEVEYRPDCSKIARDDAKGCRKHFGVTWNLHFRGEPDIPIGDESAMATPASGWSGTVNE